jgi:rhodanese-related sulfurtransferase
MSKKWLIPVFACMLILSLDLRNFADNRALMNGIGVDIDESEMVKESYQFYENLLQNGLRTAVLGMIRAVAFLTPIISATSTNEDFQQRIPTSPIFLEEAFYNIQNYVSEITTGVKPVPINGFELQEMMNSDPNIQVIDVRSPVEFQQLHIPGSISIPLQEVNDALKSGKIDLSYPVVFTCQDGFRGYLAALLSVTYNFQEVYYLEAGTIGSWVKSGLPVERG